MKKINKEVEKELSYVERIIVKLFPNTFSKIYSIGKNNNAK